MASTASAFANRAPPPDPDPPSPGGSSSDPSSNHPSRANSPTPGPVRRTASPPRRSISPELRELVGEKGASAKPPDPFDGSDASKLQQFLLQLALYFQSKPKYFSKPRNRVVFAVSYLRGSALEWFAPSFQAVDEGDLEPDWMDDYPDFVRELRGNFGEADEVDTARTKLTNLAMSDTQKITHYIIRFNNYATKCNWEEKTLVFHFYKGLCPRLKDAMVGHKKGTTTADLKELARDLDRRYWERQAEKRNERHTDKRSDSNSGKSSGSNSKPSNSGSHSGSGSNSKSSNSNSNSSSKPKSGNSSSNSGKSNNASSSNNQSNNNNMDGKLGKDGKLTPEERQRRISNNLCLFCGKPGHVARDCTKSTSKAAKARAAKTSESASGNAGKA